MIKTRNTLCLMFEDAFPDEPSIVADLRLVVTQPKVCKEIAAIIKECPVDSMAIHARLISGLSDFVFYRGAQRKPCAGKDISGLWAKLAEVLAAYIAIKQIGEDEQ